MRIFLSFPNLRQDLRQRKIRRMYKRAVPYKIGTDLPQKIVMVEDEGYMAQHHSLWLESSRTVVAVFHRCFIGVKF